MAGTRIENQTVEIRIGSVVVRGYWERSGLRLGCWIPHFPCAGVKQSSVGDDGRASFVVAAVVPAGQGSVTESLSTDGYDAEETILHYRER
jgi:hypothetical protein